MHALRKHLAVQLGTDEFKRCDLCDKADGSAIFACGHPGCSDCVANGECQTCAPLMEPNSDRPLSDVLYTKASTSLQDTLQSDEYQRQRISEKLKVEKELFPECIQAPAKYFNKRKSLNVSKKGKENRHSTIFPGEEISSPGEFTMNKVTSYVQEWLSKQSKTSFGPQPRSPFSDLKVNTHHNQTHSTPVKDKEKENVPKLGTRQLKRKRPRLKQTPTTPSNTSLENFLKPVEKAKAKKAWGAKRLKQEFDDPKPVESKGEGNHQNNENVIEIEECCTIEDTQDSIVDKDRMALLEVHRASLEESVEIIEDTEENSPHSHKTSHVAFLKKSYLFENCSQCIDASMNTLTDIEQWSHNNTPIKSNEVSITVENKSFIATISIVDCNPGKKQSTAVQTVEDPFFGFEQPSQEDSASLISKMKEYIETADLVKGDMPETDSQKTSCTDVVLEEQVKKADENIQEDNMDRFGHSSEHDFGVLNPLDGAGFQNKRPRRGRSATPDSNNSSDKENCDPNRKKRQAKKMKNKK
ncbi:uncharacterized protein LOC134744488 isoform X2 [Cydia strobilella]|uniref:uncharacterized protein LOC134744488 isoform X2 n=1 Tax=Cydia strobilella TaxID=1100964 RepID=UPI003005A456